MNVHQPLVEKKIQNRLADAVRMLNLLGNDASAIDLEQTAANIQAEFDEARHEEYEARRKEQNQEGK